MSKFASMVVKNVSMPLNENPGTTASAQPGTFQGPPPSASLLERFYDPQAQKSYIYVKLSTTGIGTGPTTTNVATTNGTLAYWQGDPANGTVTAYMGYANNTGVSGATTMTYNANLVAGVFLGAVTAGNYTLIQTGGDHPSIQDSTTPLANDGPGVALVSSSVTTSPIGAAHVLPGTAPTFRVFAYATGAEVSAGGGGTIPGFLILDKDY